MNNELFISLLTFVFVVAVTPGPNNFVLLASGAHYGFRRTVPHMSGVLVAFPLMVALTGVGLLPLFAALPVTYLLLKIACIAFLLFLAWKIATASVADNDSSTPQKSKPLNFVQGALFCSVNPKAWGAIISAISIYRPLPDALHNTFLVAAIFLLVNVLTQSIWTLLGTQLRRFLRDPLRLRIFNVTMALLLIATLIPILFH